MSLSTIVAVLGLLGLLWLKLKSFLFDKKVKNETSEIAKAKENAEKKVGAADSAAADFEQRLRDYKSKKND